MSGAALRRGLLACALGSISVVLDAATVEVLVRPAAGAPPGRAVQARVKLLPASQGAGPALAADVAVPGAATFEVAAGSTWQGVVEAPGFWAASKVLAAVEERQTITYELLPAGVLEGEVQVPPGREVPRELALRFQSSPGAAKPLGEIATACAVAERRFRCTVPAGRLDLHLRARGFLGHHRWDVGVAPGAAVKLGTLRLEPGAAVIGWIVPPERDFRFADCSVELEPRAAGSPQERGELERRGSLVLKEGVNARGFFELAGVAPGSYRLVVRHPRFAPARIAPVDVLPGAETEIRAIELSLPVSLEVHLEPAADPYGSAWIVELLQEGAVPGTLDPAERSAATTEGVWRATGLEPGRHVLRVNGSFQANWHHEELDLVPGMAPHRVRLSFLAVRGEVRLGEEPLRALLWFGGSHGAVKVAARSDEQGRFEVTLPEREEPWRVEVTNEPLGLHGLVPSLPIHKAAGQRFARVEIDLPDTAIRGRVVDESDRPVPDAGVEVASDDIRRVRASAEGAFEIRGLAPGPWRLQAEAGRFDTGSSSDTVTVQLAEDQQVEDVRLVLRRRIKLTGQVIGPDGQGLPGAAVYGLVEQEARDLTIADPYAVTDVGGVFVLGLPAATEGLLLTVLAPGFAATQLRVDARRADPLLVPVSPVGGTLVLSFEGARSRPGALSPRYRVSLFHQHLLPGPGILEEWARDNGMTAGEPDRMTIPLLEPGSYTVCFDVLPLVYRSGRRPAGVDGRCASGELGPFGELVLEVPVPDEAERGANARHRGRP